MFTCKKKQKMIFFFNGINHNGTQNTPITVSLIAFEPSVLIETNFTKSF